MAKLALIILSTYFFASDLLAGGLVLRSKKLPKLIPSDYRLLSTDMFIDDDGNTFLMIDRGIKGKRHAGYACVYMNDNPINIERYGKICDGFLKDGHFHLACKKDDTIFIYKIRNGMELLSRLGNKGSLGKRLQSKDIYKVIPGSGPGVSYYLLANGTRLPANPVEFLIVFFSGGHGVYYTKPFLIEVQDEKLSKPRKLRYGGKIDESYSIRQVVQYEDLVHFLGFRTQEERDWGPAKGEPEPEILHHAAYDLKKKKVVQTHPIYTNTPKADKDNNRRYFYGFLSMDAFGKDVFVVFSWIQEEGLQRKSIPKLNKFKSTIFYWQYSAGVSGDVEKIADGFLPVVRIDSSGDVHILWVDKNCSLVHKAKRNGKWGSDTVLVNNLDVDFSIIVRGVVTAEFDNNDNLHVVYPSGGTLVHSVLKVD